MSDSKAGTGPIVIINPNSSVKVTEEIARSVAPFRCMDGPEFECIGIAHGPATISTMHDSTEAALNVAAIVQSRPDASAFVVACFSDPGVDLCRTLVRQPVIGIQEAGILSAMAQADLFGIVALGPASVARHRLRIRQMGVEARMAAELPWTTCRPKMRAKARRCFNRRWKSAPDCATWVPARLYWAARAFRPAAGRLSKRSVSALSIRSLRLRSWPWARRPGFRLRISRTRALSPLLLRYPLSAAAGLRSWEPTAGFKTDPQRARIQVAVYSKRTGITVSRRGKLSLAASNHAAPSPSRA